MTRRLTFDKDRAIFYRRITGDATAETIARATASPALAAKVPPVPRKWESLGPENVAGRLTCVAVEPGRPNRVWVGSAGGGVWLWDGSAPHPVWKRRWNDREETLNIGSLLVDPDDPAVLYCGTGEANLSFDSDPGRGVYRSGDGGAHWDPIGKSDDPAEPLPRHIGSLAIRKELGAPDTVWIAGIRNDASEPRGGLFSGTTGSGGQWDWERHDLGVTSSGSYQAHAVLASAGEILVAVTEDSAGPDSRSGIWRWTGGDAEWEHVWSRPGRRSLTRIALARCEAEPRRIYGLVTEADDPSGGGGELWGILRSDDFGQSFRQVMAGPLANESLMTYNCTIAVHPVDPDRVVFGGIDLYLSEDGGASWRRTTRWTARSKDPDYVHADHHSLLWLDGGAGGTLLSANDGGLAVSEDGGRRWRDRSAGLAVTQFYDVEVAGETGKLLIGGGTQDNGTIMSPGAGATGFDPLEVGDGGWLALDDGAPPEQKRDRWATTTIAGTGFNVTSRSGPGGEPRRLYTDAPGVPVWAVPIELHPTPDVGFSASDRVYRTLDFFESWEAISRSLDGSPVVSIRVSPADPSWIYVATWNGGLFRSEDTGLSWSHELSNGRFGGTGIASLCCSAADRKLIYVCLAGPAVTSPLASTDPRIWRSNDGGIGWQPLPVDGLPVGNLTAVTLGEDAADRPVLAVSGAGGVWKLDLDSGSAATAFVEATGELPRTQVTDLVWHEPSRTWTAATYGRGLWQTKSL